MGITGPDVQITLRKVAEDQPLVASDSIFIVVDQYGDGHLVEEDGAGWIATSPDALSEEGYDRWLERAIGEPRL